MAKLIAHTKNMPEIEWLQLRKKGIGGSDAAAVCGVNKYRSPFMVYMDKLNLFKNEVSEQASEAAHFGHILEPIVRNEFVRRINEPRIENGLPEIRVQHKQAIFAHDEYDWMRTNLDGIIHHPELGLGVFEAKTAHYMLSKDWEGEDVPDSYFIQCQHNMAVMGYDYSFLAVLIGGNTYKHFFIERDPGFINDLIEIEKSFWENHIITQIPPSPNGNDYERDMINQMYPTSIDYDIIINLPIIANQIIEQLDKTKTQISLLKKEKTRLENEIKLMMGDNEIAFAGDIKVTWKIVSSGQRRFSYKLK